MTKSLCWRRVLAPVLIAAAGCGAEGAVSPDPVDGGDGISPTLGVPVPNECASPRPEWIWCDDFDQDRLGRYFEYDDAAGAFAPVAGVGMSGSTAMRARFEAGMADAGSLKLAFGRTPSPYLRPVDEGRLKYRDIYWRLYLRNESGWTGGGGYKLTRAQVLARNWAQAMVAPVWSGNPDPARENHLLLDPASGTDARGRLLTTRYNDEAALRYLGERTGATPLFDVGHVGQWHCIEVHAQLDLPGRSNGVFELWTDGVLDARAANLEWLGPYADYGINTVFVENYWNGGSPRAQERYIDNLVVSRRRIGCGDAPAPGPSPWVEIDFEDYASTAALLADCTTWSCSEDIGTGDVHLDSSVGYTAGGLTKSMRYDYLHGGDGCNSITDSRQLPLPARAQEIWAEFVVRWSDNFTTTNYACVPNDHKLIFGNTAKGNTGRWGLYVGADVGPGHTLMVEQPGLPLRGAYYLNGGPAGLPELTGTDLWDGEWHVIRLHYRHSSGNATGDGRLQTWIDGALRHDEVVNTPTDDGAPDLLRALTLGRNKDDGPPGVPMSLWWSRVRVWNTSPGW